MRIKESGGWSTRKSRRVIFDSWEREIEANLCVEHARESDNSIHSHSLVIKSILKSFIHEFPVMPLCISETSLCRLYPHDNPRLERSGGQAASPGNLHLPTTCHHSQVLSPGNPQTWTCKKYKECICASCDLGV